MTFSEKIKKICTQEGINLREFSDLTGMAYGVLKNYSSSGKTPKIEKIHQITEIERFKKYKALLFSIGEPEEDDSALDAEIISLHRQLEELGKGDEAIQILKVLAGRTNE